MVRCPSMCSGIRRAGSLILVLSGFALFTLLYCTYGYLARGAYCARGRCVTSKCVLSRITAGAWCLFINELLPSRTRLAIVRCPSTCSAIRRAGRLVLVLSDFAHFTRVFIIYGYLSRGAFFASVAIRRAGVLVLVLSLFARFTRVFIISGYLSRGAFYAIDVCVTIE